MNKQSGQTLIEVVAAISIASVVLGGLVVVVLNGLRNAKYAQNQAIATKYAQDTMEELRAIRDRNPLVNSTSPTSFSCYLGTCPIPPPCFADGTGTCYFTLDDASLILTESAANASDPLDNGFNRSIKLITPPAPASPNEKTLIVIVSWVDISGTHQSNLQTNLSQFE